MWTPGDDKKGANTRDDLPEAGSGFGQVLIVRVTKTGHENE